MAGPNCFRSILPFRLARPASVALTVRPVEPDAASEEPLESGEYTLGFFVLCAVIVGCITAVVVVIDPSSSSGAVTWILTVLLCIAAYKSTSFCIRRAWSDGAHGWALAMVSAGIVCLYLVGQAVTWEDVGLSSEPGGAAAETPAILHPSGDQDDAVAPSFSQSRDDDLPESRDTISACPEGGSCGANTDRDFDGDGSIGDELDDADGDYVPNGADANPADPTIQFSEDYR